MRGDLEIRSEIFLWVFLFLMVTGISYGDIFAAGRVTEVIVARGGRVDWCKTSNIIAHSRYGRDGYYDVWIMRPDASGVKCITCNNPRIPQLHNGQPAWHPDGRYIVFQSRPAVSSHQKD